MSKPKKIKITIENDIVISPTTTIKDVRDTLWRCRDFELSHLWQRSIFLSAFLILCFTGYGAVLQKIADGGVFFFDYYNLVAFCICILGLIFSCLWVMMGKASKAWYEIYENAIRYMEKNVKYSTEDAAEISGFNHSKIIAKYYSLNAKTNGDSEIRLKNSLFSGKGGAYSPSKLNIGIGQITFIFWGITCFSHFILIFFPNLASVISLKYLIAAIGVIVLAIFFYIVFKKNTFSSSALKTYEAERLEIVEKAK